MADTPSLSIRRDADRTSVGFNINRILDASVVGRIERELEDLVDVEFPGDLILNFKDVEYASSAFLNAIVRLQRRLRKSNKRIQIVECSEQIRQLFTISGLDKILTLA
jgi:anti-anti-sigma factor